MIIVLKSGISEAEIDAVCRRIEEIGLSAAPDPRASSRP